MIYYTIHVTAAKCNMLQTHYLACPAPVFALVMAMHALDKRIESTLGSALGITGVGLVHHGFDPWIEHVEHTSVPGQPKIASLLVQRRGACTFGDVGKPGAPRAAPQANPLQPEALADFEWSLIVECERAGHEQAIEREMKTMRLAGGRIEECVVREHASLNEAVRAIGRGFWVEDASDLMPQAGHHPMDALLDAQRSESWVLPVNLGYALLESPRADRQGMRQEGLHAFAESMVGLVRLKPLAALLNDQPQVPLALWRYGWVDDQFIVTNTSRKLAPSPQTACA